MLPCGFTGEPTHGIAGGLGPVMAVSCATGRSTRSNHRVPISKGLDGQYSLWQSLTAIFNNVLTASAALR